MLYMNLKSGNLVAAQDPFSAELMERSPIYEAVTPTAPAPAPTPTPPVPVPEVKATKRKTAAKDKPAE